jgi:hydroxymethylpyrimidine pyrophosphatase-like HAD family hydrolase
MQGPAPWPVHAMVAENGALALIPGQSSASGNEPPSKIYCDDDNTRQHNAARMQQVALRIVREVPGATVTRDVGGRETDLAIDYNEHDHLNPQQVAQVLAIMQAEGMHTTVSSIHIHGCYGQHTKWTGAQWIVEQLLGRSLLDELDRWVFVGDSGNDQAMFEHFTHSVGVANIARFAPQMQFLPRYVTPHERGAGFAQVAAAILQALPTK